MRVIRIAWGDLRRVAKDRRAVLWMIVMPLVLAVILGSAFNYLPSRMSYLIVVDLDRSELSRLFIRHMEAEGYWIENKDPREEHHLRRGSWSRAAVVPPGFGEKVLRGEGVKVTIVRARGSPEELLDVQMWLARAIVRFNKGLAWADARGCVGTEERQDALVESLSRAPLLSVERRGDRSLRPPPVGFNLSVPGFTVMFVLFMIIAYGAGMLMYDRMQGQFVRLVAAPVSRLEVYGGIILGRILLGLVQACLLLVCGSILFGIRLGDAPVFLLPVIGSLAILAGCFSIPCGVLCQTEKQVIHVSIFLAVVLAALGGCWWPIEIVPDAFKTVARFTPSYWAVHGLQRVMYFNKSHEVLLLECPILLGCGAVVLLATLPLLRRWPRTGVCR